MPHAVKSLPPPPTTGAALSFDELLPILEYLPLRELMICETIGPTFREAAQYFYRKMTIAQKTVIHCDMVAASDIRDIKRTHKKDRSGVARTTARTKWIGHMLRCVGASIRDLELRLSGFAASELAFIHKCVVSHCKALELLSYTGPMECSMPKVFAKHMVPQLQRVSYLKFDNLGNLTDETLSGFLSQEGFSPTDLILKRMHRLNGDCLLHTTTVCRLTIEKNSALNMDTLVQFVGQNKQLELLKFTDETQQQVNVHQLLSAMPNAKQLTLAGKLIRGLEAIYNFPHLIHLHLNIWNAHETNQFLALMPVNTTIEKLRIHIHHELSVAALRAFEQLANVTDVTIIAEHVMMAQLGVICRRLPFEMLTTLDIRQQSKFPLDLDHLCVDLSQLRCLRLSVPKVCNVTSIFKLVQLDTLQLAVHKCVDAQLMRNNTSNADVNDLLTLLAIRNVLQTLDLAISPRITLYSRPVRDLLHISSSLTKLTYSGGLHNMDVFEHDVGVRMMTGCMQITLVELMQSDDAVHFNRRLCREIRQRFTNYDDNVVRIVDNVDSARLRWGFKWSAK